jgi:1-deoxy-D-xylulose-5-phosphate synthase
MMKINDIQDPNFLKSLSTQELKQLSKDIRSFLIENVSKTGGHLSSNLGVVELTIALHAIFNFNEDKIVFDVGHQSYVHKILTGRAKDFSRLRQLHGLCGFQKMSESLYDVWEAGHAGTALSAALGMVIARDYANEKHSVVAVVGDGSIPNGMSFEALNHIGELKSNLIVILNDNNMSISQNVGALSRTISKLRNSKPYVSVKHDMKEVLNQNIVGSTVLKGMRAVKDSIKRTVVRPSIFTDMGLEYFGPVDGHNYKELFNALNSAKEHDGPVLVHVITTKGKGFTLSENDRNGRWHGVSQFDPDTGNNLGELPINHLSWSEIYSETLIQLAKNDPKIMALTPAMCQGSKLEKFFALYPNRSIDCGIAEEHATTLASSMALNGLKPFLSIYSTFLQRSYDQINHDIARMESPVVIGIDRSGLVGEDGPTHHGVFDVGILRPLPNMIIAQAKDANEAQDLLYTAFELRRPYAIRYPRGSVVYTERSSFNLIETGTWTVLGNLDTARVIIIAYGPDVDKIKDKAESNSIDVAVINARFFKPLDDNLLNKLVVLNKPIIVYETDMLSGGLGSAILEWTNQNNTYLHIKRIGIEDHFVTHGSLPELRKYENIDISTLFNLVKQLIN